MDPLSGPIALPAPSPVPLGALLLLPLLAFVLPWWQGRALLSRAEPQKTRDKKKTPSATSDLAFWSLSVVPLALAAALLAYASLPLRHNAALFEHGYNLLRIGSLDANVSFSLDPASAILALGSVLLGIGALLLAAVHKPTSATSAIRFASTTAALTFAALLSCLTDDALVFAVGWALSGVASTMLFRTSDRPANVGWPRLSEALLLGGLALLFWGLGGGWLASGDYQSDYNARFVAVKTAEGERDVQLVDPATGKLNELNGSISMLDYPGAEAVLGIATERQLSESTPRLGTAPFRNAPVDVGIQKIAILLSRGATVGGDGNEDALIDQLAVPSGSSFQIIVAGPTLSFRAMKNQMLVRDENGQAVFADAFRSKRMAGNPRPGELGVRVGTVVALLLVFAFVLKLGLGPGVAGLVRSTALPRSALALALVASAVPAVALAHRLDWLFASEGMAQLVLGTIALLSAGIGALVAVRATSTQRRLIGLALGHAGFVGLALAAGTGAGAVVVALSGAGSLLAVELLVDAPPKIRPALSLLAAGALPLGLSLGRDATLQSLGAAGGGALAPVAAVLAAATIYGLAFAAARPAIDASGAVDDAESRRTESRRKKKRTTKAVKKPNQSVVLAATAISFAVAALGLAALPGGWVGAEGARWLDAAEHGDAGASWPVAIMVGLALVGWWRGRSADEDATASTSETRTRRLIPAPLMAAATAVEHTGQRAGDFIRELDEAYFDALPRVAGLITAYLRETLIRRAARRAVKDGQKITSVLVPLLLTASTLVWASSAHAHEEKKPPPEPAAPAPSGPPGVLSVSTGSVELQPDDQGFVGTFDIENVGEGPLVIDRIWIDSTGSPPATPPGTGVFMRGAGKNTELAPGQRLTAEVRWLATSRARELYTNVRISTNEVDDEGVARGPYGVAVHAETDAALGPARVAATSSLWLLPLLGGMLAALFGRARRPALSRAAALFAASSTAVVAGVIFARLDRSFSALDGHGGFQLIERVALLPAYGLDYVVGIDGLSAVFLVAGGLVVTAGLALPQRGERVVTPGHDALLLVILATVNGALVALDGVVLLAFLTVGLIATAISLGTTGEAGWKVSGRLLFIGGLGLALIGWSFWWLRQYGDPGLGAGGGFARATLSLLHLETVDVTAKALYFSGGTLAVKPVCAALVVGALLLSGAFPAHTWVIEAARRASPGAALVSLGLFRAVGFFIALRWASRLLPEAFAWMSPGLMLIAALGIAYAGIALLTQRDLSSTIGYASVGHVGAAWLGLATLTPQGMEGAALVLPSHALALGVALAVVGATASHQPEDSDRLDRLAPTIAKLPFVRTLAVGGLLALAWSPGFGGFWGGCLTLWGAVARGPIAGLFSCVAVGTLAVGLLRSARLLSSDASDPEPEGAPARDLRGLPLAVAGLLLAALAVMGVAPSTVTAGLDRRVLDYHRIVDQPSSWQIADNRSFRSTGF